MSLGNCWCYLRKAPPFGCAATAPAAPFAEAELHIPEDSSEHFFWRATRSESAPPLSLRKAPMSDVPNPRVCADWGDCVSANSAASAVEEGRQLQPPGSSTERAGLLQGPSSLLQKTNAVEQGAQSGASQSQPSLQEAFAALASRGGSRRSSQRGSRSLRREAAEALSPPRPLGQTWGSAVNFSSDAAVASHAREAPPDCPSSDPRGASKLSAGLSPFRLLQRTVSGFQTPRGAAAAEGEGTDERKANVSPTLEDFRKVQRSQGPPEQREAKRSFFLRPRSAPPLSFLSVRPSDEAPFLELDEQNCRQDFYGPEASRCARDAAAKGPTRKRRSPPSFLYDASPTSPFERSSEKVSLPFSPAPIVPSSNETFKCQKHALSTPPLPAKTLLSIHPSAIFRRLCNAAKRCSPSYLRSGQDDAKAQTGCGTVKAKENIAEAAEEESPVFLWAGGCSLPSAGASSCSDSLFICGETDLRTSSVSALRSSSSCCVCCCRCRQQGPLWQEVSASTCRTNAAEAEPFASARGDNRHAAFGGTAAALLECTDTVSPPGPEEEGAVSVSSFDAPPCVLSSFLGVADGVGGWNAFGVDARRFASELMARAAAASSAVAFDIRESRWHRFCASKMQLEEEQLADALRTATQSREGGVVDDGAQESLQQARLLQRLRAECVCVGRELQEAKARAEAAESRLPYGGAAAVARGVLRKAFNETLACGASTALVVYCDSRNRELGVANLGDCSMLLLR